MQHRRLTMTIDGATDGIFVDTVLRTRFQLSSTVIRRIKWLDDGILIDGRRVNTRYRVKSGEVLSVRISEPERRSGIPPVAGTLCIVWEDADLIVLDKQAGVSVHPGPGHYDDTIGNFLLHYYETEGVEGDFHPVHRLDKGTSGLMVVARHPHAQERLKQQLHTGEFRRGYLAVCEGIPSPASGIVEAPITAEEGTLKRRVADEGGQWAKTAYETVESVKGKSLLRLDLETGRTHQIRVHMAHIGHPLVGDFLYGTENQQLITRPALHSAQLQLTHPLSGEQLHFSLPLPEDMRRLVETEH